MNPRKVDIIGCGNVGASIAFSLMPRGLFSHMVLPNIDQACAEGEAMDLSHGSPYAAAMTIEAGSYLHWPIARSSSSLPAPCKKR